MERGIYFSAMGMNSLWGNIETIANNLANVETSGYKRDEMVFEEFGSFKINRLYDEIIETPIGTSDPAPYVGELPKGVGIADIATIHTQGAIKETENPLDLAINGDGFFAVKTPNGEMYTRNGAFTLDKDGFLATLSGNRVLSILNTPIQIQDANFTVTSDGTIMVGSEEIAKLKLVDFENKNNLNKIGDTLFKTDQMPQNAFSEVKQGFLEASNCEPVLEMVRMIEVQRLYEANQKVALTYDELLSRSINDLGRLA
ncbi:MAG: flagellar basal-body rod protein FlgF [bacterium]